METGDNISPRSLFDRRNIVQPRILVLIWGEPATKGCGSFRPWEDCCVVIITFP